MLELPSYDREAYVVCVGDQFVGTKRHHRELTSFDEAELFRSKGAAKRIAAKIRANDVKKVTISMVPDSAW